MLEWSFNATVAVLWAAIGVLIWILGFASHRLPRPGDEVIQALKAQGFKTYVSVPSWARVLCGFRAVQTKPLAREAVFMQLVGWHTLIWGIIAGYAIHLPCSPFVVVAGIFLPIFSSASLVRYWEHREHQQMDKTTSIDKE
jgi:hypothetical protein